MADETSFDAAATLSRLSRKVVVRSKAHVAKDGVVYAPGEVFELDWSITDIELGIKLGLYELVVAAATQATQSRVEGGMDSDGKLYSESTDD